MSNQVPERVSMSTSLLQEVLDYLSNQRFAEVSTLIRAIEGDVTAVEEATTLEPTPEPLDGDPLKKE